MNKRLVNDMDKCVSVIVPVFNAAKYLKRCLESILAQSYKNWVAILVNDGSTDSSLDILNFYAKKDKRFRVINKGNGGASSARNAGLDALQTEYFCFVDADDEIEPKMLETLYSAMVTCTVDMVICGIKRIVSDRSRINLTSYNDGCHYASPEHIFTWFAPGPFAKLFNRNIIEQFNIRFPLGVTIGEDYIFVATYWQYVKKVYVVNEPFYLYYDSQTSVCRKFSEGRLAMQIYKETLKLHYVVYEIVKNNNGGIHSGLDWQKALLRNHLLEEAWAIDDVKHSKDTKVELKRISSLYYDKLAEGLSIYVRIRIKCTYRFRRVWGLARRYAGRIKRLVMHQK